MFTCGIHSTTPPKMNIHTCYPLGPISSHELLAPGTHSPEIHQLRKSPAYDTWPHLGMNPSSKSLPRSIRPPKTAHADARMRCCKTSVRHPQAMCSHQLLSSMESQNNFPLHRSTRLCQSVKCSILQSLGPMLTSVEDPHANTTLL